MGRGHPLLAPVSAQFPRYRRWAKASGRASGRATQSEGERLRRRPDSSEEGMEGQMDGRRRGLENDPYPLDSPCQFIRLLLVERRLLLGIYWNGSHTHIIL